MEERQYKYDAFISYRHCELDKYVAENLHRILETYELPKSIKKRLGVTGKAFKRIFRDQEELPLSSNLEDPIIEALKDSKYLIVICSPRLKDSLWCKKEIETFKKLRGRKNIFCVLVEGEPNESFPEEVCFDEVMVKDNKGKEKIEIVPVEPLAADVRGKNKSEVLKKIKDEKLRLVAPMYNLDYDDLKQRHKLRRQKQIMNTSLIIAVVSILFAIYSLVMFIKINTQQNILAKHQALSLANQSIEYLKNDSRYEAVKSAYEALTEFEDVNMPYTADAEYALTESLGVYDAGSSYKAISEIKTDGVASYIKTSNNLKYGAVYDESDKLTLFDTKSMKTIKVFDLEGSYMYETSFSFIGDDKLAYINKDGNIIIVDATNGNQLYEIKKIEDKYISVKGESKGDYLTYTDEKSLFVFNVKENKEIVNIKFNQSIKRELYYSDNSEYVFAFTSNDNFDINKKDYLTLNVIKISDNKVINNTTINAGYISGVETQDNNAYILLNNSIGNKYTMIVMSYNYVKGSINWTKNYEDDWGKYIIKSYADGVNNIAVVNYQTIRVFNMSNGNVIATFNANADLINIFAYTTSNIYLAFLSNGEVDYVNMPYKNMVVYKGRFNLNVDKYSKVGLSENGFLLIPSNDNRVILYEQNFNQEMKEENIEKTNEFKEEIKSTEYDELKEQYNIKNKSLVNKMLYSDNKDLLFVSYTNHDLAIYNVSDKKLLNTLKNVGSIDTYFGKDKYGRIYIGDISDSYILDKDYNKVGHVKGLYKVDNDKLIISSNSKYYSIKIYTLKELKEIAENYLDYK